jgi:hypothetical protein
MALIYTIDDGSLTRLDTVSGNVASVVLNTSTAVNYSVSQESILYRDLAPNHVRNWDGSASDYAGRYTRYIVRVRTGTGQTMDIDLSLNITTPATWPNTETGAKQAQTDILAGVIPG